MACTQTSRWTRHEGSGPRVKPLSARPPPNPANLASLARLPSTFRPRFDHQACGEGKQDGEQQKKRDVMDHFGREIGTSVGQTPSSAQFPPTPFHQAVLSVENRISCEWRPSLFACSVRLQLLRAWALQRPPIVSCPPEETVY